MAGLLLRAHAHGAWILRALGQFIAPIGVGSDGTLDDAAKRKRSLRMVGGIAAVSVIVFVPSLIVAGVPLDRWPIYLASILVAACVISVLLLGVRPNSRGALVAAAVNALVVSALGVILSDHYHQIALLFALIVIGHASIHGLRAALVMVLCGGVLVPLVITPRIGVNATDPIYAFLYLAGMATVVWIRERVALVAAQALRASESKYRRLVQQVPAIVYTAKVGVEGAWTFVSPQVRELLGFPAESWTSDPAFWWSRIHPEDRERVEVDEVASSALPAGHRTVVEYRMIHRDGAVRWVRDEASLADPGDGGPAIWNGFLVDVTDRRILEEQLEHQAFHDPLTGLANRALFGDRVGHALARTGRRADTLAVVFLDLDDFKTVNDGLGHDAGDELLVAFGARLASCLRPMDTAARLGGDEFAILLEDLPGLEFAEEVAERILVSMAVPFIVQGREVVEGVSIGIAGPSKREETVRDILRNADSAMYAAKRRGKGRFETFDPEMHDAAVRRLELMGELRQAIDRGEMVVHYQPTVRLRDATITGFEALVRWNHPQSGLVLPGQFIPLAEETGQILAIGRFVLAEASRQLKAWQAIARLPSPLTMSVNVSGRQFRDPSLPRSVAEAIECAGIDPSSLIIEITESVVMEDSEASLLRVRELKALGVRLAIDDFGTGYSSLSYLRRLPVDILKVDKSFIDGIGAGGEALELARVIVRMGRTLELDTVAEGVELPAQAAALRQMGCGQAQGFHFARPMSAADAVLALTQGRLTRTAG